MPGALDLSAAAKQMGSAASTVAAATVAATCFCCGKVQQQAIEAAQSGDGNSGTGRHGADYVHGDGLWPVIGRYSSAVGSGAVIVARHAMVCAETLATVANSYTSSAGGLSSREPFVLPPAEPLPSPDSFKCPITREVMRDPVMTEDGQSYERGGITAWFQQGHSKSPLTNNPLGSLVLTENVALRGAIEEFQRLRPSVENQRRKLEDLYQTMHARGEERELQLTQSCSMHEAKARSLKVSLEERRVEAEVLRAQLEDALKAVRAYRDLAEGHATEFATNTGAVGSLRQEVASLKATLKAERQEAEILANRLERHKLGTEAALLQAQVVKIREELRVGKASCDAAAAAAPPATIVGDAHGVGANAQAPQEEPGHPSATNVAATVTQSPLAVFASASGAAATAVAGSTASSGAAGRATSPPWPHPQAHRVGSAPKLGVSDLRASSSGRDGGESFPKVSRSPGRNMFGDSSSVVRHVLVSDGTMAARRTTDLICDGPTAKGTASGICFPSHRVTSSTHVEAATNPAPSTPYDALLSAASAPQASVWRVSTSDAMAQHNDAATSGGRVEPPMSANVRSSLGSTPHPLQKPQQQQSSAPQRGRGMLGLLPRRNISGVGFGGGSATGGASDRAGSARRASTSQERRPVSLDRCVVHPGCTDAAATVLQAPGTNTRGTTASQSVAERGSRRSWLPKRVPLVGATKATTAAKRSTSQPARRA